MNKFVLVVAVAGCWSSSSDKAVAPTPRVASQGSAMNGGATYGGDTYGINQPKQPSGGAISSITGTTEPDDGEVYGGLMGNEVGEMQGGFGTDTGWGTIGTGKYGTIGHGSGTGNGYGNGARTKTPVAKIGNASASGDYDKNIIRRYIRRQLQRIKYCYEKELVAKPDLQGTVVVDFTIDVDGKVSSSNGSGVHANVATCVADAVRRIEFPRPPSAKPVVVRYPFVFSPG